MRISVVLEVLVAVLVAGFNWTLEILAGVSTILSNGLNMIQQIPSGISSILMVLEGLSAI